MQTPHTKYTRGSLLHQVEARKTGLEDNENLHRRARAQQTACLVLPLLSTLLLSANMHLTCGTLCHAPATWLALCQRCCNMYKTQRDIDIGRDDISVTYHRHTAASHIYSGCLVVLFFRARTRLPLSNSHALRAPADSPGARSSRLCATWMHAHSIKGGTAGDVDICEAALVSLPTTPRQEQIQACGEAHFRNTLTDSALRRLERPQPCQESVNQYKQGNILVAAHVGRVAAVQAA